MEKEMTRGEMLKEKAQALRKVKLTDPKMYWRNLEMEGKHCLRDI